MKKVYLYCGLFLLGATSFAQRNSSFLSFREMALENELSPKQTHSNPQTYQNQDRALNTVWTEDFTTGTGLVTANGTWVTAGANGSYWTIATTAHPLSAYGWTHAMTGRHLRWDSYNPNDSEVDFATTVINGSITSPSMDLSSAPNGAILEFITESMYCCNYEEKPWVLYVSENDGATWSAPIPLDFGVDRNVATEDVAHPMAFSVDITPYISTTPSTVKIRIAWEATNADPNGQINTHYFWMLDNMSIYEIPPYQIEHSKLWLADIVTSYEYGEIPIAQGDFLTVQSEIKSMGLNVPTNLGLEVTVYDASMTQLHQSTGGTLYDAPMSYGDTDTMTFTTTFDLATLAVGEYTVRVVTTYDETDEISSNDTLWRTFNMTENILSHFDFDQPTFTDFQGGTGLDEHYVGAAFYVLNDAELHGIDFYIGDGSDEVDVAFYIYEAPGTELDGPFTFPITSGMLGQYNSFNLHQAVESYSPFTLVAGTVYYILMRVDQGTTVEFGMNPFDADYSGTIYVTGTWYWTGNEPMIGLNFDQSLALQANEKPNSYVGQNVPNPFDGTSVISYSLTENSNVSVEFVDVTGKVVKTVTPGSQEAGTYSITIDGADLAEGVYFYTFTIGDQKVTKQMVVTK